MRVDQHLIEPVAGNQPLVGQHRNLAAEILQHTVGKS